MRTINHFVPTAWENSRNVPLIGCKEELVWSINRCVEAKPCMYVCPKHFCEHAMRGCCGHEMSEPHEVSTASQFRTHNDGVLRFCSTSPQYFFFADTVQGGGVRSSVSIVNHFVEAGRSRKNSCEDVMRS